MRIQTVIGTPAWDRAWSLPLWFASVRANVEPESTGLVFVVPGADLTTRDAITRLSEGFAFCEVHRDRGEPVPRAERPATEHRALASARNQILQEVERIRPRHFISWDTDLIVPPGAVAQLAEANLPLVTVWAWLNRQLPRRLRVRGPDGYRTVLWQEPVCATAMEWDRLYPGLARHYPAYDYEVRSHGVWRCGVALAFQMMDARAYLYGHYRPHRDGEDVPFNWQLQQRGIPRFCCGDIEAVHLYDRNATDETVLGWPGVLSLAKQRPLAATWTGQRPAEYEAAGFFPATEGGDLIAPNTRGGR